MTRTTFSDPIAEKTSQQLTARIRDLAGLGFKPETLTLTLYDVATGTIINNRNHVSIRDANGGTVSIDGLLTLQLDPADTVIVTPASSQERHIALLEWTWSGGTKTGRYELEMLVNNLAQVT